MGGVRNAKRMTRPAWIRQSLILALLVIALDQATKWWMLEVVMQPPRVIEITPFFNLVLAWNRGISFGMFNNDSPHNAWILPMIALVIIGALAIWLVRAERAIVAIAIGMIIGGAIGNLIDRLRFGAVADFLDVHAFGFHWPAFNVADSAITLGVITLLADSLFGAFEGRKRSAELGEETGK